MLAIDLRFPAGRYHATPWDSHVNEGVVEWPPCPWRLLRALIAVWHLKAREEVTEPVVRGLVDALASELPRYGLAQGAVGFHTRHYMPLFAAKSTKVMDTFLHLPEGAHVVVAWPALSVGAAEREGLAILLSRLGYLGRAEAWVEATLTDNIATDLDCLPARESVVEDRQLDLVRVLAPLGSTDLMRWRASAIEKRVSRVLDERARRATGKTRPTASLNLTAKERAAIENELPASPYDALILDTETLRHRGWSRPPGSRWVDYVRPRAQAVVSLCRGADAASSHPSVARFALASRVPPRLTEAVFEAEKVHAVLVSHSEGAPVFTGCDAVTRTKLQGHRHAFIVPEANACHGQLTHITVYAPMGFDERARLALNRLRWIWSRSGHDVHLVLLGLGRPSQFAGTDPAAGQCPLFSRSSVWVSRTPFVATRHPKCSRAGAAKTDEHGLHIGSPEHDLIRLLLESGLPRPTVVERIDGTDLGGRHTRWLAFRTERRRGKGARATAHGTGFRIRFPEPVAGPILIGYGAHFGLGCFLPE